MRQCAKTGLIGLLMTGLATPSLADTRITAGQIADWTPHSFTGETRYTLVDTPSTRAVRATCDAGTASGLFYREGIDLRETPIIEWRWRIVDPVQTGDPSKKTGDDYAARLYAVDEHTILRWRTRAINYVSTPQAAVGDEWPNAYASQARMLVVDNADGKASDEGGWRVHRRNLRADFQRLHGRSLARIDAIALMTDCDDTGERAEALYGEIRLLPE
jgi:hypothetical protein